MKPKLFAGLVTYGNPEYTRVALSSLLVSSLDFDVKVGVIVGMPEDEETWEILRSFPEQVFVVDEHEYNMGFPHGVNQIMEWAFKEEGAEELLFIGNDVYLYPNTVLEMMAVYQNTGADFVQAREIKSATIRRTNPQFQSVIDEDGRVINWAAFYKYKVADYPVRDLNRTYLPPSREIGRINGFHNCSIISKPYFEQVGYIDVNFYPAYYEDVDYVRRGLLAGMDHLEACHAPYLHFHSQTIKSVKNTNPRFFPMNVYHYDSKWGGTPGNELFTVPFNGAGETLPIPKQFLNDINRINYWRWTPRRVQNIHKGQRCLIVAPGTSLNDVDPKILNAEVTIALNGAFEYEGFGPTYIIAVNPKVFKRWPEIVDQPAKGIFIPKDLGNEFYRDNTYGLMFSPGVRWTGNIDHPIYQGHTVTYCALELAYYMGFNRVGIVGLDHYYGGIEEYPTNHAVELDWAEDPNHFHGDYWGKGVDWDTPNIPRSEEAYDMARHHYHRGGRVLFNCSTKTALSPDIIPQLDLEEFLEEKYEVLC